MAVRGYVAAATAAAAFAAGFLTSRGCATPADDAAAAARATASTRTDPPDAAPSTPERRRPRRPGPPADAASADQDPAAGAAVHGAAPPDDDFPFVDVLVTWPNGDPAGNAVVYALPAGAACTEGTSPPNVSADGDGRARLHVVEPARYDVGALLGAFQTMSTDVDLPRTAPLHLVLPEPSTIVVRMPDSGRPEKGHEREYAFRLHLVRDSDERRAFPGRGEVTEAFDEGWVQSNSGDWIALAPRGARCRIEHSELFRVEPETFAAPAEVAVAPARHYLARVRATLYPADHRFDRETLLDILFRSQSRSAPGWVLRLGFAAGTTAEPVTPNDLDLDLDTPSGTLTWTGAGVRGGSVPFSDLDETTRTRIDARVELDPSEPKPVEVPPEYSLRVANPEVAGADDVDVHLIDKDGNTSDCSVARGAAAKLSFAGAKWAVAWHDAYVSEFVEVPATPAGDVKLELAPGGFLVVVPTNLPPAALGGARLRRPGGLPLLAGPGDAYTTCEIDAGLVVGPLRPGTATFEVLVGDRVLATVTAEVRAGTYETLRIPRLRAR